jgi:type IV pilus assembly protein PilV
MKTHGQRNTARAIAAIRHGRGMTLIEVLVTLVIISVGLLGVAALQLTTVRNNYDAFVRSQAAVLAGDMFDRIRANRGAAIADPGAYNVGFGQVTTPTTVAQRDMAQWKAMLTTQLPNGQGSIVTTRSVVDGVTRNIVTITITWGERSTVVADRTVTFVTSSQI